MGDTQLYIVDGRLSLLDKSFATVACWTCRSRRLKCDRRRPACAKCTKKGHQCLGYGANKPLIWTGLARRGKLVGRTFADIQPPAPEDEQTNLLSQVAPLLPRSPTDPTLQDFSMQEIEYIRYYEQRCCVECSIYDEDSTNPFRQFLVLSRFSPLLRHTIVSLAAYHRARDDISFPFSSMPAISRDGHVKEDFYADDTTSSDRMLASAHYFHALSHKKRAIQLLRQALTTPDYSDAVITSTLLLIWVELLESEKRSWRFHLDGMKKLICFRNDSESSSNANMSPWASNPVSIFREYLEETYLMLDIFGSTLSKTKTDTFLVFRAPVLENILKRAERWSWTGCPAELVQILCTFKYLSSQPKRTSPEVVMELFNRLETFSCLEWATNYPEPSFVEERNHLACAYKGAIEIYGCLVMRENHQYLQISDTTVHTTIAHLSQINHQGIHFKGTLWPAFVAGAEAKTMMHRLIISRIFHDMYNWLHSWNVKRGRLALERIWARSSSIPLNKSWIDNLYEEGEELLLI